MNEVIVKRTPGEVRAYLAGFKAAARLFEDRARVHTDGEPTALRAAAAEVKSIAELIEHTLEAA